MNQHKQYPDPQSRRQDRIRGVVLCLVVNAALLIGRLLLISVASLIFNALNLTNPSTGEWFDRFLIVLPWLVNGGIIIYALLRRPEVAIGYLGIIVIFFLTLAALGVLFVAGCFAIIIVADIFSSSGSPNFLLCGAVILIPIIFVWIAQYALKIGRSALAPPDDKTPPSNPFSE